MEIYDRISRRSLLTFFAAAPLWAALAVNKHLPIGLELYSVRNGLKNDLMGTVRSVAKMGYECVEFYAPYYDWTLDYAKQVRRELDTLGLRCYSTHNSSQSFTLDGIKKAIELNQALGAHYIVLAHPGNVTDIEGWKRVAEMLNRANEMMVGHGLHAGYHNHELEWKPVDGQKPIELIAASTDGSIMLQLDVGTCLETGNDPVAWVERNPGRIRSMHCKDWSQEKGYGALFGEGAAPWRKLFTTAERAGGIEYYLIEQPGSDYSEIETAERCLAAYRKLRG